jgi:hypothetical protein
LLDWTDAASGSGTFNAAVGLPVVSIMAGVTCAGLAEVVSTGFTLGNAETGAGFGSVTLPAAMGFSGCRGISEVMTGGWMGWMGLLSIAFTCGNDVTVAGIGSMAFLGTTGVVMACCRITTGAAGGDFCTGGNHQMP